MFGLKERKQRRDTTIFQVQYVVVLIIQNSLQIVLDLCPLQWPLNTVYSILFTLVFYLP